MHLASHTPHKKARIEIIPLIDIMFFLLASFMLVSMSMIKLQKIETKLPGKNAPPPDPSKKPNFIAIGIDKTGAIYFDKDKDPVAADAIPARLQPFYAKSQAETKVFINCDQDASYEKLVGVLDAVRQIGITKVSFAVKSNNTFDPNKPRPTTHDAPDAAGAPAAPAAPAAPVVPPPANP